MHAVDRRKTSVLRMRKKAEQIKRTQFRKGSDGSCCTPVCYCAVCGGDGGYMIQEAVRPVNRLGDMLREQGMRYKVVSQCQC